MDRIPYVIDNDRYKLADVLNQVLENHADLAMDVATASSTSADTSSSESSSRRSEVSG